MANNKSQKKRIRQDEKRNAKNTQIKSSIKTASKKLVALIASNAESAQDQIQSLHNKFVKTIDSACRKGKVHWKTAARSKSRMAKKVNATQK